MKYKIGDVIITRVGTVEQIESVQHGRKTGIFEPLADCYYTTDESPWGIWEQYIADKIPTPEEDGTLKPKDLSVRNSFAVFLADFKSKTRG